MLKTASPCLTHGVLSASNASNQPLWSLAESTLPRISWALSVELLSSYYKNPSSYKVKLDPTNPSKTKANADVFIMFCVI